jgi:hypothetical protein
VPFFWIVHQVGGARTVFIAEAGDIVTARLKASLAGHHGQFDGYHVLSDKLAEKIPKEMLGRVLTQAEAEALLNNLD